MKVTETGVCEIDDSHWGPYLVVSFPGEGLGFMVCFGCLERMVEVKSAYCEQWNQEMKERRDETIYSLQRARYDQQRAKFEAWFNERKPSPSEIPNNSVKTTGLTFAEALSALKAGKTVKRPSWGECTYYILNGGMIHFWSEDTWSEAIIESSSVLATDWEIVPEPIKKTTGLTFEEALAAMRQGKKVRRPNCIEYNYRSLDDVKGAVTWQSILATDWEIAE